MATLGNWANALIVVWRDAHALDDIHQAAERLLEKFPRGIGVLGISDGEVPLEGAAERQRVGQLLCERGVRMLGLASVIEGNSDTREVMNRINLVTAHPCPLGVFDTIDEAVSWLAPRLGHSSSRELRHAVDRLKS